MARHTHRCTSVSPSCPVSDTVYGYYPNIAGNSILLAVFAICTVLQIFLAVKYKLRAFPVAVILGCFGEMLGYVGRVLMHSNPWNQSFFDIQICCLVLSPSFLAAGIYLSLKHLILHLTPTPSTTSPSSSSSPARTLSRLPPSLYPPIFIGCDVVSILMQAAGGGTAASETSTLVVVGDKIIVAGIAFQVATMSICGLLGAEFAFRLWRQARREGRKVFEGEGKGFEFHLLCTTIAFITIFIRCVYRIPEMAGGWGNPLMRREAEFLVLDGAMVAVAALCLTVGYPGAFFPEIGGRYRRKMARLAATTAHPGCEELVVPRPLPPRSMRVGGDAEKEGFVEVQEGSSSLDRSESEREVGGEV